ncbi:MAG: hypothetical protein HQ481_08895 [Alphaproteobacteria bacterium]|nr:hypothetical protein [Alphaproteobacteria bacterium]
MSEPPRKSALSPTAGADSARSPAAARPVKQATVDRRAEALRANLRRRKAQSRSREVPDGGESRDPA